MSQAFSADGTSGTMLVTDGPHAQTTENLGGITIIEVPTIEEARNWAAKVAEGCGWPQEVRVIKQHPPERLLGHPAVKLCGSPSQWTRTSAGWRDVAPLLA